MNRMSLKDTKIWQRIGSKSGHPWTEQPRLSDYPQ